jgi:hypothetical protein
MRLTSSVLQQTNVQMSAHGMEAATDLRRLTRLHFGYRLPRHMVNGGLLCRWSPDFKMSARIQIVFYSMYGHVYQMAEAIAAGHAKPAPAR